MNWIPTPTDKHLPWTKSHELLWGVGIYSKPAQCLVRSLAEFEVIGSGEPGNDCHVQP